MSFKKYKSMDLFSDFCGIALSVKCVLYNNQSITIIRAIASMTLKKLKNSILPRHLDSPKYKWNSFL